MSTFAENLAGGLRRVAMAGVGAVAVTVDKSKELFDHLAEKGETAAAETHVSCDELQQKLAGQLDAFAQKLKTDHENADFNQLLARCMKLSPEQKARLVEQLTAEPEAAVAEPEAPAAETQTTVCAEAEPDCVSSESPSEAAGDE